MTQNSAFKSSVRARMDATGEPYNVARRNILADRGIDVDDDEPQLPGLLHVDPPTDPDPAASEGWRAVHWTAPSIQGQEDDTDG